jgi:hypothetical protein
MSPRRRAVAGLLALALVAGSPSLSRPGLTAAGELAPSIGNSILFHLQLATDIDTQGNPIGQGTTFPAGTQLILGLLGWSYVPAGTELRLRLYQGDRLAHEVAHVVQNDSTSGDNNVGFVYPFYIESGFPAGDYSIEVQYNRVLDEIVPFTVGDGPTFDEVIGQGSSSGAIPYKQASEVLVVTRASVLRRTLGSRYDAVAAAAAKVGTFRDLEADGQTRSTPDALAEEVQRLLRANPAFRYVLILGNDDVVPYFRVENPLGDEEQAALVDWQLPHEWVATDAFYTDMDGDPYGVPDLAVARIPSSNDADLLLKQLGDNQPPNGGGFALINQQRKGQAGLIVNTVSDLGQVRLQYAPPVTPEQFAANADADNARYLYVLLHGIGTLTNAWSADTVAWFPSNEQDPLDDEWLVAPYSQQDAVTVESDPGSHGVVFIGACYGAWTLDTIQAPQKKTADNNLALHYLKNGTRAYIADTHLSYSTVMGPTDTPRGRTGFELILWRHISEGMSPIDAFQAAKVGIGEAIDDLVADGQIDSAKINLKTLHYMVYLGRP